MDSIQAKLSKTKAVVIIPLWAPYPKEASQHSSPRIWNGIEAVQRYYLQEFLAATFSHLVGKVSHLEARRTKKVMLKSRGKRESESW